MMMVKMMLSRLARAATETRGARRAASSRHTRRAARVTRSGAARVTSSSHLEPEIELVAVLDAVAVRAGPLDGCRHDECHVAVGVTMSVTMSQGRASDTATLSSLSRA